MQALFAQINPHFIINTLTSIRSLIFFGDNSAAEKAMRTFAFLLKKTLSREDEMCTLGEINLRLVLFCAVNGDFVLIHILNDKDFMFVKIPLKLLIQFR